MQHTIARHIYQTIVLLIVVVPLLATGLAVRLLWQRAVHWPDLALLAIMYTLVAIGVTVGYHRMLTHRGFTPHPAVKFVLLVLGSMALEGDAITWTATHTKHHALADRPGDPHSPLDGFFHAHLGWIFAEPDADPKVYCRHLLRDRMVVFVSRTHLLWVALALAIPCAIGGALGGWLGALTGLLWGGLVRQFLTHHVTWSVNSICHTFGKRTFETNDASRNEWIVGLLAFGEGWHNNHHAFPRSAFHGLRWWQFDLAGYVIRLLERLGLAHDVYRVAPAVQAARRARSGAAQAAPATAALEERVSA
ncbi:MAG TPA: acyl-CoA desaturase [Ktedonobacterales bacterium]|jgi:stearoyl-CoA desaturase (delta-9 desaturase)